MSDCQICACLEAQRIAAIEQGSQEKLRKAQELIARHQAEHERKALEREWIRVREEATK